MFLNAQRVRRGVVAVVITMGALGAVLVAGVPAGATSVSTEAELRSAFATDATVELANDITLTDCTGGGSVDRTTADPVVLDGQGHTITQTCTDNVLVQQTVSAGLVTVQRLTVTGGSSSGSGGGIFAVGDLHVSDTILHDNHAAAFGGGIAVVGEVVVERTLVDHNNASQGGGGIAGNLEVTIRDSTVSNNLGGGAATGSSPASSLVVVNSTITGNSQAGIGAGLFSSGSTTLVYSTVTDNHAIDAFGNISTTTMTSFGSVVTGGIGGATQINCLTAPGGSQGYNYSDDDSCRFTAPTDREEAGPPGLGALGANGGPTPTRLPLAGSPLLDAIPVAACRDGGAAGITTDQRAVTRPQGTGCDIGAVEVEVAAAIALQPRFTG